MMQLNSNTLHLKRLGINTYKEAVIYMRSDCHVCRAEGFDAHARIQVTLGDCSIIATLNIIESDLLNVNEASLSLYAWKLLKAKEGDVITVAHAKQLNSLSYVRSKIYGNELSKQELAEVINDITAGYYSDVHIATFLAACAGGRLNANEILNLTQAMVQSGETVHWGTELVVDKHCVGGLPGNRTSLIVVPIVAAFGLTIPKTSSYAITSPAGSADTMAVLAPVELDIDTMRKVVEQEQGCIVWGGGMALSPADDILIRIEKVIDLDSEGQLVASVLSKKIAAGSSHVLIDIPIGPTAKVRTPQMANLLKGYLEIVGKALGVEVRVLFTDGQQPVGRGLGPALEARDVLAVLQNDENAPQDLRERALTLAGLVLEFSANVSLGTGKMLATQLLTNGQAWKKFQAICKAQGGMFEPPIATYTHVVTAKNSGRVSVIDNRRLARLAKLAGAPQSKAAGIELLTAFNTEVIYDQPLFVIHAQTKGELKYAIHYMEQENGIIQVGAKK